MLTEGRISLVSISKLSRIYVSTLMTLSFRTDKSGQTVQTKIRLLLDDSADPDQTAPRRAV